METHFPESTPTLTITTFRKPAESDTGILTSSPIPAMLEDTQQQDAPTPVVFRSLAGIPNCNVETHAAELDLAYTKVLYFKPSKVAAAGTAAGCTTGAASWQTGKERMSGYYELAKSAMPSNSIRLYPSSMKALVKNLHMAISAAKWLETNPDVHDDDSTFDVCTINKFGNMSTKLVVNTFRGEVFVNLKLFTTNEATQQMFPTSKGVRFGIDDLEALTAFIQGKK
jgi:Transcriptional Coactivator p15 (PC4)